MMDGSKIWASPSKVSELTSELNWSINKMQLFFSLLQCLCIIVIEGLVSQNQQRASYAASSKMIKLFQSTSDNILICCVVRGYFVSQYTTQHETSYYTTYIRN